MPKTKIDVIHKIRSIADYQFGRGLGMSLFPDNVSVIFSKRTGKIKHIYYDKKLLATLKPNDGHFSLGIEGAKRLMTGMKLKRLYVQVQDEVAPFVENGSDVFARHVVDVDQEIRPGEETIILDGSNRVIAIGRADLSGSEMRNFRKGVAVKVRRGNQEKIKKQKSKISNQ